MDEVTLYKCPECKVLEIEPWICDSGHDDAERSPVTYVPKTQLEEAAERLRDLVDSIDGLGVRFIEGAAHSNYIRFHGRLTSARKYLVASRDHLKGTGE